MQHERDRAADDSLLSRAVQSRIANNQWTAGLESPLSRLEYKSLKWAVTAAEQKPTQSIQGTFEQYYNGRTQHHQEHSFPVIDTVLDDYNLVEIARIAVPDRNFGIIRSIEQVMYDVEGDFFPTSSEYWGRPYHGMGYVDDCRWLFSLQRYDGQLPPRFAYNQALIFDPVDMLPGYLWPELPIISGLWYPPNSASGRINLYLEEGSLLRFFFFCTPLTDSTWQWRAGGRLRATIQGSQSTESMELSRMGLW